MSKIQNLVIKVVREIGEDQDNLKLIQATENTLLFGENLDSMGIVFLVTDIEAKVYDKLGLEIALADERAMSLRTSPFRSVATLVKYAKILVDEAETKGK